MKILIYGAGIVGSTYGWQLSKAGHEITVLVRTEKKQDVKEEGVHIHCSDFRGGQKKIEEVVFKPDVIDSLSIDNNFEYIIVSTNNLHLKEILPILSKSAGNAHILFLQNMWIDDLDSINKYLSGKQYFFGFPFMVGGGRDADCINSVISGLKQSHTPLGELNGEVSGRVQKIAKAFEDANLKPIIYNQIKIWLITHYAVAAGLSAGIMKAKSGRNFASNSNILKEAIRAIREGLEVCQKLGYNPKVEKANTLYSLPFFIAIPIAKKVYSNEALCLMFDGHTQHSPDEMKKMLEDIIMGGEKCGVKVPILKHIKEEIFN
ncbi:ketopantoate reductase family protein [Parabacteroides sp. Marseille-P3160]|uniref:ketopantoate reductase family protein n=1 Tax=Parabacteroides sp. Marseille-P3160 TaxID=1917887 RepID=UPI0009BB09CC|nr:2-dehydropantoate 2-reductase N-terminal domain-containing protein [Parabacteroides sp. Marseille-P3160]